MTSHQDHDKFKLFAGKLEGDGTLGALGGRIAAWAKEAKAAPKSIGIEYVESADQVIFSLGYRDDEAPYAVSISSVRVGKLGGLGEADLAALERAMCDEASKRGNLICHELYVTAQNDLLMVFMTRAD